MLTFANMIIKHVISFSNMVSCLSGFSLSIVILIADRSGSGEIMIIIIITTVVLPKKMAVV